MREILVLCEGQTEREFCRGVVAPHLLHFGVILNATLVGKAHQKRGGIRPWTVYRKELIALARERADRHVALIVDFYGMPPSWPGRSDAARAPILERARCVESALVSDLEKDVGERFHPSVALHEFESLLFVSPEAAAKTLAALETPEVPKGLARSIATILANSGSSVEAINDSPSGAPSKRLAALVAGYDKVAHGPLVTKAVGIRLLREGCPWLDRWVTALERIGAR